MSEKTTRNISFDLLRILACLMVLTMHAQPTVSNPNGIVLSVSSYATAPCIGLFFMISGALRLSRPISSYRQFFVGIIHKIIYPVLLWNLLYGIISTITLEKSWLEWSTYHFLFELNNPTLWFIFPLLGLYLLTPILQSWVHSSNRIHQQYYLILWGITLCLPWFKDYIPIEEGPRSAFYYFSGYIGYFLLGYYIHHYSANLTRYSLIAIFLAWLIPTIIKVTNIQINFYETFWYLSIFVAFHCIFWMQLANHSTIVKKMMQYQPIVQRLSQLTFGVYLVHWLFIVFIRSYLSVHTTGTPFIFVYLGATIFSLIGSFLLSYLLSKFRRLRFIIGL